MKKNTLTIIWLSGLLSLAALCYLWLSAPQKLETTLSQTLRSAGFENITFPVAQKKIGQITYQNIALDSDGFSTLKTLTLSYNPLKLALLGRVDSIHLSGLDLTGELTPQGQIVIAGWNTSHAPISQALKLKSTLIEIENARLSLLNEKWGGMSFILNAQLHPQPHHTSIQGRLSATQRQLSTTLNLEGQITDEGFWDLRMEIEKGKFTLSNLRASRIAGLISVNGQNMSQARILGELEAGGLNVASLPWQESALTIDGTVHEPRMILAAKSTGVEGLELGLTIPNMRTPSIFSGTLHTDKLANIFEYLDKQKILPVSRTTLASLDLLSNINIIFSNKNSLMFNIKNEDQKIDIKGNITSKENKKYTGSIQAALLPLASLTQNPRALGTINIQGDFTTTTEKIFGTLQFQLAENAILPYGVIPLTLSGAKMNLKDWENLSGPPAKSLPCTIRNLKPNHTCTLSLQINKGQIIPSTLKLKVAGLNITAPSAPRQKEGTPKTLLKINEADINTLFKALKKPGWAGTGYLTGTAALHEENGQTIIDNLHLKNKGVGILKLKDNMLFKLMEMEELEKETMKLALENFHYDLLEIKASGTLPNDIRISVFGKGKNPSLMQGRTFSLDFKVKPNFAPLLSTLFPTTKTD